MASASVSVWSSATQGMSAVVLIPTPQELCLVHFDVPLHIPRKPKRFDSKWRERQKVHHHVTVFVNDVDVRDSVLSPGVYLDLVATDADNGRHLLYVP